MLGLLAVWRALGLDVILRECWESGVVLAGLSARARCAGSSGASRTSLGHPAPSPGLGFLPGSLSVHMDGEPARLPVCRAAIADGTIPPGYAADDGVALLFRGTSSRRSSPRARTAARCASAPTARSELEPRLLARRDRFGPTPEIAEFRRVRVPARPRRQRTQLPGQSICLERWKFTPSSLQQRAVGGQPRAEVLPVARVRTSRPRRPRAGAGTRI